MNTAVQQPDYLLVDKKKQRARLIRDIKNSRYLYLMIIPIIVWLIIFKYGPMYGIIIAFKDYKISQGIFGSTWVGFKHFIAIFTSPDYYDLLRNSLLLNLYGLIFSFPIPIFLALLLNEVKNKLFKKVVQSILYLPHFLSWIILGGIVIQLLSPSTGAVNSIIKAFGGQPIYFLADTFWWPVAFIGSSIWKESGWGTIIYLAAISNVDPELFEAARIDGANKFRQIWHITLPAIKPTVAILLIMRMGGMMDVGFEHVYILSNPMVRSVSDVFSTYVFRMGIERIQYSYTAALGLFQSIIGLILIIITNSIVRWLGEDGLW